MRLAPHIKTAWRQRLGEVIPRFAITKFGYSVFALSLFLTVLAWSQGPNSEDTTEKPLWQHVMELKQKYLYDLCLRNTQSKASCDEEKDFHSFEIYGRNKENIPEVYKLLDIKNNKEKIETHGQ